MRHPVFSLTGGIFGPDYTGEPFGLFSLSHLITLFIMLALIVFLFMARNQMKKSKRSDFFRYGLAFTLLLTEVTLNIWYYSTGIWDPASTLPFQLCSVTLILCIIMLITNKYFLYEITYFTGLGGAGQAMLTPELFYPFPHYRFFHFFVAHIAIILSVLWMTWVEGYRPTFKSIWKTFGLLNVYVVFIFALNTVTGGNYLFLAYKPTNPSLLDYLGPYPWYILSLEAVALVMFFLLYLPFYLADKKR